MKKSIAAIAILSSAAMAASASASLLIYEPFAPASDGTGYASGSAITGQVNTTSAASETWQVVGSSPLHVVGSGSLSPSAGMLAAGFPTSIGNDADLKKSGTSSAYDRLSIPNAFDTNLQPIYTAGSTLYYSLLLDVPSITGLTIAHSNGNANNDGLIAFNSTQGSTTAAPNSWVGELAIRLGSTAGTYNLGIRSSNTPVSPNAGDTYWTGDLTPGDTHFVVVQEVLGTSNSMWLDPSPTTFGAASAPTADGSSQTGAVFTSMQSLIIGAGIATAGAAPNDTDMDEIRVGTTWADVTPAPEPTMIGLFGIGAMGLVTRRRRTA